MHFDMRVQFNYNHNYINFRRKKQRCTGTPVFSHHYSGSISAITLAAILWNSLPTG